MKELSEFEEFGYSICCGKIESFLISAIASAVDEVQASIEEISFSARTNLVLEKELLASRRGGIEACDVGNAIFIIGDPPTFHPIFNQLLDHQLVTRFAKTLLGSENLTAHFMNVTIKNPHIGRSIGWHRDYPNTYFSTKASDFIRLMICLDGMQIPNGATRFIRGSHRISDADARSQKESGTWPKHSENDGCAVECEPGQIVAIHSKILHGGGMNVSHRPRRNVILQVGLASAEIVTTNTESITGRLL